MCVLICMQVCMYVCIHVLSETGQILHEMKVEIAKKLAQVL
jgi:hypothetical protein